MKQKLTDFILRLVFSRLGPTVTTAVSTATGFLLGWIVSGTSAIGLQLDANQQIAVSLGISNTIYWLLTELVNKYAGEHTEALQKALKGVVPDLEADRWIGSKTIAAAAEAAQKAALNPSTGEIYEGKPVPQETPKPKPKRKRVNPLKR